MIHVPTLLMSYLINVCQVRLRAVNSHLQHVHMVAAWCLVSLIDTAMYVVPSVAFYTDIGIGNK